MTEKNPLLADMNVGSIITDHNYRPSDLKEPWGLCAVCNLGEAAHAKSDIPYVPTSPKAKVDKVVKPVKTKRSKPVKKRTTKKGS